MPSNQHSKMKIDHKRISDSLAPGENKSVKPYPTIRYVLGLFFTTDFGFSLQQSKKFLADELASNKKLANEFKIEVLAAFSDGQLSWSEMLLNDEYEVAELMPEVDARNYAMSLLWDSAYPKATPPELFKG
ncbi:MAG: hypothetical protein ACO1RA_01890 [Planctomycetaceae bacterium]